MRYRHSTSKEWLAARKSYLTATDIISLWPTTPTGRPAKQNWTSVVADKLANVESYELSTTGQQARGHCLESYALLDTDFHHWDDILVALDDNILAFSPDGMSYKMPKVDTKIPVMPANSIEPGSHLVEVKAFDTHKHMNTAYLLDRGKNLDVVKQISVGLMSGNIDKASIILFAPQMVDPELRRFIFTYHKDDDIIKENIKIITEIKEQYVSVHNSGRWNNVISMRSMPTDIKETDIVEEIMSQYELNV